MKTFLVSLKSWLILTVLTGALYPLLVTAIGQLVLPFQANGSLIRDAAGNATGSELLAQAWGPGWFQGRPSTVNYDSMSSGASNLSATSATLRDAWAARAQAWLERTGTEAPAEMLAASGGGFDPDMSIAAARAQVDAVLRERGVSSELRPLLLAMVDNNKHRAGLFGEGQELVNVQILNAVLAADGRFAIAGQ